MSKIFYVTTPIYYPNGIPHVGTAYTTIAADILARWHKFRQGRSFFLTGTDEHGQKVEKAAKSRNLPIQEHVNEMVQNFKKAWEKLNIQYDDFIRTTENRHTQIAVKIFKTLLDKGEIYKGEYEGWYCVSCETFWIESQVVEKKCPNSECGRVVEWVKAEEYFFKLSNYQKKLLEYYDSHPNFVQPTVRFNEVKSLVTRGLLDICVSRKGLEWGIPVPGDPERSIYVWIDALTNYISAIGYDPEQSASSELFRNLWPADVHLVGKDILRFHAVIWPAILMALNLPLPQTLYVHGWLTMSGSKISKSRGGYRDLMELLEIYGPDPLRYFLMRETPFGQDLDFSEEGIIRRLNTDLANDLGNLAHRVLSMIHRYFNGEIPAPETLEPLDLKLKEEANNLPETIEKFLSSLQFREALMSINDLIVLGNKYVDETAPWKLKKEGKEKRLGTVLYLMADLCRMTALALSPFLPAAASNLWRQLNLEGDVHLQPFSEFSSGKLVSGRKIGEPSPLFQKIDEKKDASSKEEISNV
ncbi:MAG: methionine--tRNA ligase [Firmicutes bacterium]|jgi:methionyl-tRNA synthetase|nr:methionine--tRNA ligase [Bacillota bacterium]